MTIWIFAKRNRGEMEGVPIHKPIAPF